jgi:hypothetical protein
VTAGTAPDDDDSLAALATGLARLFCEVEAGLRPRRHLEALMDPWLVARLADHLVRPGPPRRVVRVRGMLVAAGRYEATVALDGRGQVGALAVRIERRGAGWCVVDLGRPEDGQLPQPAVFLPAREPCAFELLLGWAEPEQHEPLGVAAGL